MQKAVWWSPMLLLCGAGFRPLPFRSVLSDAAVPSLVWCCIILHFFVGECVSARGAKDTFDGSAQGNSPCEDDINKGLVDGRVEGRAGVHVESEVVLKCEDEGACDMLW